MSWAVPLVALAPDGETRNVHAEAGEAKWQPSTPKGGRKIRVEAEADGDRWKVGGSASSDLPPAEFVELEAVWGEGDRRL